MSDPNGPVNAAKVLRKNGWAQLLTRAAGSAMRRIRDSFTARQLNAPGFRARSNPRLYGLSHMCIGRDFQAGDDLWLEAVVEFNGQAFAPELILGDGINVSSSVHIACIQHVEIGSGTLLGSHVIISDHAHGKYQGDDQSPPNIPPNRRPLWSPAPIRIGKNVWIGDGVAVLAGADIGDGAVIGANSVVTGVIPPATIAYGAPARPVRQWNAALAKWVPFAVPESGSAPTGTQ